MSYKPNKILHVYTKIVEVVHKIRKKSLKDVLNTQMNATVTVRLN